MYGMYRKLAMENTGTFTGKGLRTVAPTWRPEATGYGAIYFLNQPQHTACTEQGKTVRERFGQVAWGAVKKRELRQRICISGPDGYIYDAEGVTGEKIDYMLELRNSGNDVVAPYAEKYGAQFFAGKKPWEHKADIYLPQATQNELDSDDARKIKANNAVAVCEVSNMGCTAEASEFFTSERCSLPQAKR